MSYCRFQTLNAQSSVAKELYKQGKKVTKNGNYLDAASKFTRALAESPDYTDAMYYAASSYYSAGENEKAVKYFEKLEAADPSYFPWYLYLKGNAQADLASMKRLLPRMERFLEVVPRKQPVPFIIIMQNTNWLILRVRWNCLKILTMADPVNLTTVVNSVVDEYPKLIR
ncbi:MAG: tetratricopeptide repeat protein [Bacteroidales bacterium]